MITRSFGSAVRWTAGGMGLATLAYAAYVAVAWSRYGHPASPAADEQDDLLDRFIPVYDVVERHHVHVAAPAEVTLAVARDTTPYDSPFVRAIFKGRELIMRSTPGESMQHRGLLTEVQSLGWVVLAEAPSQEIVVGAVTKPWEANVTFRSVPSEMFAAFNEPDYVKIAWTLRADRVSASTSIFRSETRAWATDAAAQVKFRRYWSCLSPGSS
jgi:hypothetical protein